MPKKSRWMKRVEERSKVMELIVLALSPLKLNKCSFPFIKEWPLEGVTCLRISSITPSISWFSSKLTKNQLTIQSYQIIAIFLSVIILICASSSSVTFLRRLAA